MDKNGTVEDLLQEAANEVTDNSPSDTFPFSVRCSEGPGEGRAWQKRDCEGCEEGRGLGKGRLS